MLRSVLSRLCSQLKPFSERYWEARYGNGGNSGPGSFHKLAEFKAEVINKIVITYSITSVIEFGCGDGNQLQFFRFSKYLGFDVSSTAITLCRKTFANDSTKTFRLANKYKGEKASLTLSLDVIYHLVEDHIFQQYMERLFDSSMRFVIIYSSNTDDNPKTQAPHVRHRDFTRWIEKHKKKSWSLIQHIPNTHPFTGDMKEGSFADFYLYELT